MHSCCFTEPDFIKFSQNAEIALQSLQLYLAHSGQCSTQIHLRNEFVLVCIHQLSPAAAVTWGALLWACSWTLLVPFCKLLFTFLVQHQLVSFFGLVANSCLCMRVVLIVSKIDVGVNTDFRYGWLLKIDINRQQKHIWYRQQIRIGHQDPAKESTASSEVPS